MSSQFARYVGIDYSGAETADSSLIGLSVYQATPQTEATEILSANRPKWYWTRRTIANWLVERLLEDTPTLVGIDHGFSFPLLYFQKYGLSLDWPAFLVDFQKHWPTDFKNTYVDFVRDGYRGQGSLRCGDSRWRLLVEVRAGAKSVFHFDFPGSVAKSTHAGLPWLLYIRNQVGDRVHFWPFDGWQVPEGKSAIAEIYPALWSRKFRKENRNSHQHDAYVAAEWMRRSDVSGTLPMFLSPVLAGDVRVTAAIEGFSVSVRISSSPTATMLKQTPYSDALELPTP